MSKYKVLIVDDELGIRESLKLILEKDYDVAIATGAEECLGFLKENPVDVAFLDIKMPRVSGLDIIKKIKSLKPDIKIVMVTGYRSVETAAEAINLGADDYIVKPFASKDILEAVRKALGP